MNVNQSEKEEKSKSGKVSDNVRKKKPVTHIMSQVHINLLTDTISLSKANVPPEMAKLIQINHHRQIMPILKTDFFNTRLKNLVQVTRNTTEFKIIFYYKPIGIGKLRLMLMVEHAMQMMQTIGFSKKDIDEVKAMFSDTNVYLLCGTIFVASIHVSIFIFELLLEINIYFVFRFSLISSRLKMMLYSGAGKKRTKVFQLVQHYGERSHK